MELATGRLPLEEYKSEVAWIVELFQAAGVKVLLVTFGAGCDFEQVDPLQPVPVPPTLFAGFLDAQEKRGVYQMGYSDLYVTADEGRVAFLLCEETDIHCYTDEPAVFEAVRKRWALEYAGAYEADRERNRLRDLRGSPWKPYER